MFEDLPEIDPNIIHEQPRSSQAKPTWVDLERMYQGE